MLRRFILVGVFVVIEQGTVVQLAYATLFTLLYLTIQVKASPFDNPSDDFLATTCSAALSSLFMLSILYKYGEMTQVEVLQAVMSIELKKSHLVHFPSVSAILFASCIAAFVALGVITLKLAGEEAARKILAPKLRYLRGDELVKIPKLTMSLNEMIQRGGLYAALRDNTVEEPMPTAGPFHLFLSHNWKHGQVKMRVVKELLREILPAASIFLE